MRRGALGHRNPPWSVSGVVMLLALALSTVSAVNAQRKTVHTVFTTECNTYFNWQALGIYHSHKKAGQHGPITRLLSCTEEQLKFYKDVDGIPTHVAPSWTIHPRTGDVYSGINKPVAVKDWLEKVNPPEDYILIIDSDTIMRESFDVDELEIKPGWAVSGFYGYLKGVNNELAMKHIPDVLPRNDTLAGPVGRRSDQVGGFTFMQKQDLANMAAAWVSITEDVRADPDAWTLSGDVFTKNPGDKPWIAEMYGYSYAAAKANVWHHTNDRVMLYPGYLPLGLQEAPKVLHYGIEFVIPEPQYSFDKHWYQEFDPLACPPWTKRNAAGQPATGLFPNPPHPSLLKTKGLELLRDLLAVETITTVNEALCLRHTKACPPDQELDSRCHEVFELAKAVADAQRALSSAPSEEKCDDDVPGCSGWAALGECKKNPGYMLVHCKLSCGGCKRSGASPKEAAPKEEAPTKQVPRNNQGIGKVHTSGMDGGHKDAAAGKRDLDAETMKELLQACLANTQLSMAQVKECMRQAKQGVAYKPAALPRATQLGQGTMQARPNLASEEIRKASPDEDKGQQEKPARRLGEGIRDAEPEVWEGEHTVVVLVGVGLLVAVVLGKAVLPLLRRSHQHGKGFRRD